MLIKDYKKYLNLSKVLNHNFGMEGRENKPVSTQSIMMDLLDDGMIKCRYIMIANFGSDSMLREMQQRYRNEALGMLEAALKRIKDEYKERFKETINFDIIESSIGDDVEFLTFSVYNGLRKGYYRLGALIEIS